jgi:hypothetical protein
MIRHSLATAAVLSLALTACDGLMKNEAEPARVQQKLAPATHEAQIEADIMVGRVEVMQEQTHQGLIALGTRMPALTEYPTDRQTYRRLTDAVGRYNELDRAACTAGIATGNLCGPTPYLPLWAAGRARPDTSPTGLKAMAEDMQNQMTPLWDAVCTKAKAKTGDQHFCAIE